MVQKHRINTRLNTDKRVTLELKQNYDLLEILSLKFTQQDAYTSLCADYGVVCGRISVNNGLGVPNARVSIFVPLTEQDELDPVISALYPYKLSSDTNTDGYKYNLLPSRKQHGGHEPTGTFPDQTDILTREEYLEVFEKYFKYTVKTNSSGDFMIWGVPLGEQLIHVDVDLSDIGCFSLRPDDFINQGFGVDSFKNTYSFKSSTDYASLPQIVSFEKTIDVAPFWGNVDLCQIGITRTDFDLSDQGVKIEPKAYLLGSVFSDQGNNAVNKNCRVRPEMGLKCGLTAEESIIEILRFTNEKDSNNRPTLEIVETNGDIDDSGSFLVTLPMNMEYVYTNEFGENEITNDSNKGVPTSACYRFRISSKNESLGRVRTIGSYLVPNIREYATSSTEIEKSYAWSTNWEDYPSGALNETIIFNNVDGSYYPQDYFYRLNYNKVYSVSSFFGSYDEGALRIKEIAPKAEDDCENNIVTPPINFGTRNSSFSILLATIVNTLERILFYAFLAVVQVLIIPFQILYSFRIRIRAFGVTLIDWRPFGFFDSLVIEPLQRFGTLRLGIAIYPECETCDNLDYSNDPPDTNIDPEGYYTEVGSGTAYPDSILESTCGSTNFADNDTSLATIYLQVPSGIADCSSPLSFSPTLIGITIDDIVNSPGRYIIKIISTETSGQFDVYSKDVVDISGVTHTLYYFDDTRQLTWSGGTQQVTTFTYKIFDSESLVSGEPPSGGLNSELQGGCQQYVTVYKESIVAGTYCVTDPSTPYSSLTSSDIVSGTNCTSGKVTVGQVIRNPSVGTNPCGTCGTHSGFSEFRYGLFTIIPAASTGNWGANFDAITEYSRRKLVAKLFCGGVANYSFIDNWLTGTLYMFPFKAKVRWDDEENLDLNVRRTKYCSDLVYFKAGTIENPDKRFYYRSTYFNGTSFNRSIRDTLGHPTTIMDLGPRDEFIKEICIDPSVDPNCSVIRNIGPTSYQNFKELLGLYINYKLDYLAGDASPSSFFENDGFDSALDIENAMNGDILQLISINNEVGIEEFDLQNRNYAAYNPQVLDVDSYPSLFDGGPMPINFVLDDGNGFRVRTCINEDGKLTESSQEVPFYLWNKGGTGFGSGVNQAWNYGSIQTQPLQGMTFAYNYTGNSSHKYLLPPMTKLYSGNTFTYTGVTLNDVFADIETTGTTHTNYDNQEEGFTVLEIATGTEDNPLTGTLWTRTGDTSNWASIAWTNDIDFVIKPTTNNYSGNLQILSTPFLFYFGLRPGKTAVDKFIKRFGPNGAFPSAE
jgi:hypothetical protein